MHRDIRGSHLIVPGLRELLDASPDLLFACDADGALLWLSRAFQALTGRAAADHLGGHWSALTVPREARRVAGLVLRQRRRRLPLVETALPLLAADGSEVAVAVRVSVLERPDGSVIFVGTARRLEPGAVAVPAASAAFAVASVPEPRTAEPAEEAPAAESHLVAPAEVAPAALPRVIEPDEAAPAAGPRTVVSATDEPRLVESAEAAPAVESRPVAPAEAAPVPAPRLVAPAEAAPAPAPRPVAQATGAPRSRGALASAFAFLSRAGKGGALAAARPVAAQDEPPASAERPGRMAAELEEARETARARAELLSTLAHELRTPLNGMLGLAHLLLESELDRDQRGMAEVMLHAGESLLGLVDDTLEIARSDSGEIGLERLPFDLRATTEEVGALLAPLANEKHLHFECAVHEEVPAHVWGDPRRLRQVLLNLGGNAVRFTERGRVRLAVERLREDERSVTLRFSLEDTGVGMTAEQRAGVTRALQGAEAPVARRDGSAGRGLLVSSRVAARMGGAIGFESSPGRGSTVWFDVTLEKRHEAAPSPAVATARPRLAGLRVLVVEPSPAMRRAYHDQLTAWGCRVEAVENAEVGLVMLQEAAEAGDAYRLALVERQLPGMDGEEMGAAIRADCGCDRTLTVLITSAGRRGDAARARARGFSAYLTKPFDWGPLAAALAEVLRRAEAAELGAAPDLVTLHSMAETQRGALRILLVEDSAVNQLVTQWTLKRLGYSLQVAPTASEAREAWQRERFDLALLDLRLPDGDGYSLARELRDGEAPGRRVPMVALTANDGPGERERCLAAGMDEYLAKPVDLGQLCRVVRSLTGGGTDAGRESTVVVPARPEADPVKATVVADEVPLLHAIESAEAEASGVRPPGPTAIPLSSADVEPLAADPAPDAPAGEPRRVAGEASSAAVEAPAGAVEALAVTEETPVVAEEAPGPVIDLARLEVASVGLRTVRESLLSAFLEEVRPRLERLGLAVSERDARRVEHEAHGLKGMCATVGASACAARFAELERLGHERSLDSASGLLKQAHLEVTRAERCITDLEREAA